MRLLFVLFVHLLVILARLARPGGVRAVAVESLTLKHQLLVMQRSWRRSPHLIALDRLLLGFSTFLVSPGRVGRMAVIIKSSTLLRFHRALVKRKYRLLYGSRKHSRTGPRGPSRKLIEVVLEMKQRNPYFGCRKIAEQLSSAFGLELNKDIVRRILMRHYRPGGGSGARSWLAEIAHAAEQLGSVDLFRTESILLQSYWVLVVIPPEASSPPNCNAPKGGKVR